MCVANDRPQFPTWTKHWSPLGWDRAMKEDTIPCSKTAGNCLCTKVGVWERAPSCWMAKSSFLKSSFISRKTGAKISSMYTFVLTLAPFFTKIRGDFQVFDTASQTITDAGGDTRLTCLQKCHLIVRPALCHFVYETLSEKRLHPSAFQISANSKED